MAYTGSEKQVREECTMDRQNRPADAPPAHDPPPRHRHGRGGRFFRGYLMVVGALATAYLLERLLVILFVEIGKWM
jgi:hypothetical protein